jgi:hypothetical protein
MIYGVVCIALLLADDPSPTDPYSHPIKWLITLAGTIIAAAGAVVIDNVIKRMRDKRPHNFVQVTNELLAEHQVAYLTYFVALITAARFKWYWAKDVLGVLVMVTVVFYAVAVYLTTLHEVIIGKHHKCADQSCGVSLTWRVRMRMCSTNLVMAILLLIAGVYFAFCTIPDSSTAPSQLSTPPGVAAPSS